MILNQARVHDMYLEIMRNSPARLMPDCRLQLVDLSVAPDGDHPVTVTLNDARPPRPDRNLRALYVVGCDGARSQVRRAIGRQLTGDGNQAWG